MGGNALKKTITRRYGNEEYAELAYRMNLLLSSTWRINGMMIDHFITKSFREKESFGDMDVLVNSDSVVGNIVDFIKNTFQPNEIISNNGCYSFDWEEFQIDFIMIPSKYFEISKIYYSYNDLGNYMGRIAQKLGYRYGHFGLERRFSEYDGSRVSVSTNPRKIFEFLGFNYDKYLNGFNSLDEIFQYIINSKYYSYNIFQYEELNSLNKTRNKKRKNYELFLKYIENYKKQYNFKSKSYYRNLSLEIFGVDLNFEEEKIIKKIERKRQVSEKFNGSHIIKYFGIQGKELGFMIEKFKKNIKEYDTYIIESDFDDILNNFKKINNL